MSVRRRASWLFVPLVAYAGACAATSDEEGREREPETGDASVDRRIPSVDAAIDGEASAPEGLACSPHGWCDTALPAPRPTFEEIWPLPGAAFAVDRENGIYAWDGSNSPAGARWSAINDAASGLSAVWAPNAEEVWTGGGGGRVVRGVRAGGTWTWTTEIVPEAAADESIVALWGAGPLDVFALSTYHLYRRSADGEGWKSVLEERGAVVPEACGTGPAAVALGTFSFRRILATSADDMWIVGRKNTDPNTTFFTNTFCDYVVHTIGERYEVVSDCDLRYDVERDICEFEPKPGVLRMSLDDAFAIVPGRLLSQWAGPSLFGRGEWSKVERGADGGAYYASSTMTAPVGGGSAWGASEDEVYVGAPGRIYTSKQLWDGGAFDISSTALNGIPLETNFKIRGRAADDIWAIGGTYALHKTQR